MVDVGSTSNKESGLAEEALATELSENFALFASDKVQAAARAKIEDPEKLYLSLVRALRRRKGFGILFVQCTPAKGREIFSKLKKDLPKKRLARLMLMEPIDNLLERVSERADVDELNVLLIEGIEKSLAPYIKTEVGRNDYYKLEILPPILAHINRKRENFREQFPHLCFVFVVPPFALKYFMHRALDFFAWNSGIWRFAPEDEQFLEETAKALGRKFAEYKALSEEARNQKIAELQDLIDAPNQSDEQRSQLYVEQSRIFAAGQDFEVTLRCCREAINLSGYNATAWLTKGSALVDLGRYEEAITAFDQAIDINPDDHAALYNKGVALDKLGRYEDAITAYDQALAIKPDKHAAINNKGVALGKIGRYEDAIAAYDQALAIKPDKHAALYNKGIAFGKLDRYEEAITAFDQAIDINPDDHAALYNKGFALDNLGRYEEAITAYDQALAINPDYREALYNKGFALDNLGRYKEVLAAYDQALAINPDDHKALNNKGNALGNLGRYEEAITAFDKAIDINPDLHTALYNKGVALGKIGRYEEAITAFDQAMAIKPDKHEALYNKASAYALSHQQDKAITCLEKAIQLSGTDEWIELAKTDTHFDSLRDNPRFQFLITHS
jgi:tetratricopeptide (TPR) repeat protein